MIVYLNGEFLDENLARVSVLDRGFLYGDTVYETVRSLQGRVIFWPEHARRLERSCQLAFFEIDWARMDLESVLQELLKRNHLPDARLRVTLSRGIGDPDKIQDFVPTWVVTLRPFEPPPEEVYEAGVAAILTQIRRHGRACLNPEIKSGNYLNNLLARREARLAGATEGVMLSPEGHLTEGASSNLFWVREGRLETPSLEAGILHGVTREKLLEIAATVESLRGVAEMLVGPERLEGADEIMLTSTSWEVLPVTHWEGRPVGTGRRGPVARVLRERLRSLYPD